MGCNCKTVQTISYLNKKYGDNIPKSRGTQIRDKVGVIIKETALLVLIIPILPIMMIGTVFTKKPVDIGKFIKR